MEVLSSKGGFDRNFSYLIYDEKTKKALVIDPFSNSYFFEKAGELGLEIVGVLITHEHFDHVSGVDFFREKGVEILSNKREFIELGESKIKVIPTPGHSEDSVCFFVDGKLFTGDTLFVGNVGITFSEEGQKEEIESLRKLMKLPDETVVYPGHDYGEEETSTIGKEGKSNSFIRKYL